jgi:hypothetical protein
MVAYCAPEKTGATRQCPSLFRLITLFPLKNTYPQLTTFITKPTMPNQTPAFQISNFLSRYTAPFPIYSVPDSSSHNQGCPIYHNSYADPSSSYVRPPVLPARHARICLSDSQYRWLSPYLQAPLFEKTCLWQRALELYMWKGL